MRRSLSVLIFALFALSQISFAQDKKYNDETLKNKQETLLRMSNELRIQSEQLRHEAEIKAVDLNIPIKAILDDGRMIELQKFENGIPVYYSTENTKSAQTISTDNVHPGGSANFNLTGSGVTLGEWDGGAVRATHQEFTNGRVIQRDSPSSFSAHSTHVAGTMVGAGTNPLAKGMSFQANLDAYDWNNDESEMATAAARGLLVSNHSYGRIRGWVSNYYGDGRWVWFGDEAISTNEDYYFGFYDSDARQWDLIAYNAPFYLICKAAGNNRNDGPSSQVEHWAWNNGNRTLSTTVREKSGGTDGYDCISHTALAKNIMTVAAVNPITAGYNQPSDVVMSSFSSWGPTDDGRIKPDISAAGVGLYSSVSSSNTAYASYSGTSMASPSVAGSVGLILQKQRLLRGDNPLLASTVKGLILHTADEAGTYAGPDYKFGWGLMNTEKAIRLMDDNSMYTSDFLIQERTIASGQTIEINAFSDGINPIKATICWTDPAGTPVRAALNPRARMLVNDLDVRVYNGTTMTSPWKLDPANPSAAATRGDNIIDNVEQVLVTNPVAGAVRIVVTTKGLTTSSQAFSLILSGVCQLMPPTLVAPVDNATNTGISPTFRWNTTTGAISYNIQIASDRNFANVIKDQANVTTTQFAVTNGLVANTTYFWRVRCASTMETGPWSDTRTFSTNEAIVPLTDPGLISPANAATGVSRTPILKWNRVEGASSYTVELADNQTFTNSIVNISGVTDTSYSVNTTLNYTTNYYWRVKAVNRYEIGPWSNVRTFTTQSMPQPDGMTINLEDKVTCKYVDINLGTVTTINNTQVVTTVTGGSGDYTFYWSPSSGLYDRETANPTANDPSRTRIYILTVKDNVSGQVKKDTLTLTVLEKPAITYSSSSITITRGTSINLGDYTTITEGLAPYTYEWSDKNGFSSTSFNPTVTPARSGYYSLIVTDANGCSSFKKSIYIRVTSGKEIVEDETLPEDNTLVDGLNVYPNPTNGILNFDLSMSSQSNIRIVLTDMLGQEINSMEKNGVSSFRGIIDMNLLASGVYTLQVRINDQIITRKVVKE